MNKRANLINDFIAASASEPPDAAPEMPKPLTEAGSMRAVKQFFSDIEAENEQLKAKIAAGHMIEEIDPNLVDPSPFMDRLPDDTDSEFEEFKKSILEEGQKVPALVRPHPDQPGRFQIVYGRRRLRAAKDIGVSLRALVEPMDDTKLVVAQGIENGARQDLSWIERALFAQTMEDAGIKPRDVHAALSIERTEHAKMRSVYRALPNDLIRSIGRAPKIGRRQWMSLAEQVSGNDVRLAAIRKMLAAANISGASSDERFQAAVDAALGKGKQSEASKTDLFDAAGATRGKLIVKGRTVQISVSDEDAPAFGDFIRDEMPALFRRFTDRKEGA